MHHEHFCSVRELKPDGLGQALEAHQDQLAEGLAGAQKVLLRSGFGLGRGPELLGIERRERQVARAPHAPHARLLQ